MILRPVPACDSALVAAAAETGLLSTTVEARDTAIGTLQAQRDTGRLLAQQALTIAQLWPTWRKVLAGASCVATGWFGARRETRATAAAGVGRFLLVALLAG